MALFRKGKSLFSTTLNAGISTGTGETITPNSVSGLPTDTPITLTIDRVDSSGTATPTLTERITGTISGGNLINYTRGIDGSTEQAHALGAVVEYIWNADDLNDLVDGILVNHAQTGHLKSGAQIDDTTADHQYLLGVSELTADRTITLPLLTGNDDFVFEDHAQTLTNKTLTSPTIGGTLALNQSWDGWIAATDTWTYASASTFTIAGADRTAIYTKGTRLKFTQTTPKYAVVVGSSFSTNTTVTIAVNTDHTIANAAITLPNYSYAANPQGYPGYFNYAPTFAGGVTVGSGTITGKYYIVGNKISIFNKFILSSSTITGNPNWNLPVAPTSASFESGTAIYEDSGTTRFVGHCGVISGTVLYMLYNGAAYSLVTSTVPMTWANTDVMSCNFTYAF